jgi:hypothetical protein
MAQAGVRQARPLRHVSVESHGPHKPRFHAICPHPPDIANDGPMSMRWKKLLGVFLLIAIIAIYVLLVMRAAVAILPNAGSILEFVFYAVAGMAWVIPVRYLIVWMNTPGRGDTEQP